MQVSQGAGKVVWYSHLFKNFPTQRDGTGREEGGRLGMGNTTEMTRNKKEEQTALILVIQEEGPRFPVTRCAEDPSSFHHRSP